MPRKSTAASDEKPLPVTTPGAVKRSTRATITDDERTRFLDGLRKGMSVAAAASVAGISRRGAYRLAEVDPAFKAAWDDAYDEGTDRIEDEVVKLGVKNGNVVALIFMLKARRPDKYRENAQVNVQGNAVIAFASAMKSLELSPELEATPL